MHQAPFRINFSEPSILNLDKLDKLIKQPHLDIVTYDEHPTDSWIWMVITAPGHIPSDGARFFVPAAHPMHLHGHDFALLRQSTWPWFDDPATGRAGSNRLFTPDRLNCRNKRINCDNPPRRDVALLPAAGYVIIAFKADNPGKAGQFFLCKTFVDRSIQVLGSYIVISPFMHHPGLRCRSSRTNISLTKILPMIGRIFRKGVNGLKRGMTTRGTFGIGTIRSISKMTLVCRC